MPKTRPTPKRRELIMLYRNGEITKQEAMKKLGIVKDYHSFNAIFHNCVIADYNEE